MAAPKVIKRILPQDRRHGRPGYKLKDPWSCTVHNTGNQKPGADAEAHARYLEAGHAISWHATADATCIIEHLPLDEQGWHTGTHEGNTTSLGIEICEYPNTEEGRKLQAKATDNAAWWVAKQHAKRKKIPTTKTVRTHKSWSGKHCPRDILDAGTWSKFLVRVRYYYALLTKPKRKPYPGKPIKKGDNGKNVTWIKTRLRAKGYRGFDTKSDEFGLGTEAAVEKFQLEHLGATNGGIVGPRTWNALAK